ncbi:beta-ketoacyl synthase N-terminal-like domain-containing protein [Chloroflexota bacterium]
MREVAVLGVGMTKFGKSDKTSIELFSEAAMDAINESNLEPKDVQALFVGNCYSDCVESQANIAAFCAADIGISGVPATRFEGACASASVAIRDAFMWVASGFYDVVLVGGTEKSASIDQAFATRVFQFGSDGRYECFTGLTFPGIFAMMAYMYANKYQIPLERLKKEMGLVAIKNHNAGKLNPKAHLQFSIADRIQKKIVEAKEKEKPVPTWNNELDFLYDTTANPLVADPLQVFDCCPFTDGASAVVLVSADLAKKHYKNPVRISGLGQSSAGALSFQKDITRVKARELSAKQAYNMARLGPEDVDICELHDCFTIAEIVATEGLGFFPPGKGGEALEKGNTSVGGNIVVNPSGGLKAKGHPIGATGAAQVYEIVKQMREECNERQIDNVKVGITDTLGGDLGTICNIILERGW